MHIFIKFSSFLKSFIKYLKKFPENYFTSGFILLILHRFLLNILQK